MLLPAINEGSEAPASPSSSPGSNAGAKTAAAAAREKPVKVLSCPRCESMNTKFCYYNNYSVTQPRHFCKQCQRYWTAGGTLRNVHVGGGSRKKNRHHPRPGEPYSQWSPGSSSNPGYSLPGGHSGQNKSNVGFQHHHDMVTTLNLPGLSMQGGEQYVAPHGLDQLCHLSPGVYASIMNKLSQGTKSTPSMNAMFGSGSTGPSSISPGGYFTVAAPHPFQTEHTVKPEFWSPHQGTFQANRFESSSSMLLNLGLKTDRAPQPAVWEQSGDVKPAASTTGKNGPSPRHGSSIEEEGSTPSNGFTKTGYEEGDTVSSMWHSLHDMDNSQLSEKW